MLLSRAAVAEHWRHAFVPIRRARRGGRVNRRGAKRAEVKETMVSDERGDSAKLHVTLRGAGGRRTDAEVAIQPRLLIH